MRTDARVLLALGCLLGGGCATWGRATQGRVPDPRSVTLVPGETGLAQVLADLGPADEWHHTPAGLMIVYRHRRFHFARYGLDFGAISYASPQTFALSVVFDNLHLTYDRLQQADERLAVLFDRQRRVVAYAYRDDRGRMTVY